MNDTAPAPLPPTEPITAAKFAEALAEIAARLPTINNPRDIEKLGVGKLYINARRELKITQGAAAR